jgi:hypothetical protein
VSDYEALREAAEKRLQSEWTDEDGDVWIPPEELPRAVHALFEAVGLVALLERLEAAERVVEAAGRLAATEGGEGPCTDCGKLGHFAPCPWSGLDAALATFRSLREAPEKGQTNG